jgi:hypothetical protein
MNTLCPSPDWEVLLAPFQSLFTKPGFRYFRVFVFVFAHLDGRLWVTQGILSGLLGRHYTNFYQFLQQRSFTLSAVRQTLAHLCLCVCLQPGQRLLVALDDTVTAKYGEHFESAGYHHDPMNRQHPKSLSWGHCFVCLAFLAQQGGAHWVALFIGCALYVQKSACKKGQTFATKLELAAGLLIEIAPPPDVLLIAVCDGAYARQNMVRPVCASGRPVLSRLRCDTVFYDLPPARRRLPSGKYPPGKPRKYGHKHKARDWADTPAGWRKVRLVLYGKSTEVQIKTRVVLQRTFGVKMRLVAVRMQKRALVFLFCTDTTLPAEQIVSAYCARFAIETGFRDAKQSFGFATYHVRKQTRFVCLVHLCLWAQTLLRLSLWNAVPQARFGAWRKPLSYLTLPQQKRLSQSQHQVSAGLVDALGTEGNYPNIAVAISNRSKGNF